MGRFPAGADAGVGAAVEEATRATGRRPLVAAVSLGGYVALAYGAARPDTAAGLLVQGSTARSCAAAWYAAVNSSPSPARRPSPDKITPGVRARIIVAGAVPYRGGET
ncbi:hypothetical protein BX286_3190 [Streptomyces sp. 3211.6]|uniref:hypothetical protein n=1 Tax=Streptomyces sp. 3211.6 TaxID=1938845 RepID=UPI000EB41FBF|nr:hypothetical protein [Streptomyces sp. 3211.6]RKT05201.1 hypothetical protein BX286_3190 [Streptomyces sp. 3211.6]